MKLLKTKKHPFRILFIPSNVVGVNFWRQWQFFAELKKVPNVETAIYRYGYNQQTVGDWENMFVQDNNIRTEIYKLLQSCDIAILGYCHVPMILALIMMSQEHFKKKMVAEIDDYVIDTPDYNPAYRSGFTPGNPYEKVIIEHLKLSNAVVTSTNFLKQSLSRFNDKIFVIPNCINFDVWNMNNEIDVSDKVRIGWIGGANHDEDLRVLVDVIPKVIAKTGNAEFYFVHGIPQYIKDLTKIYPKNVKYTLDWSPIEKYPKFISKFGFDIGLAPLVMNKFNEAKSNLRWLEYSALKIPTIATDIQPYSESIDNDKSGFIVSNNPQEWVDRIVELIKSKSMRKEIGNNAYNKIKKEFNLKDISKNYYNILRGISK